MELLDKAKDIVARDMRGRDGKIQSQALLEGRHRGRTGHGEAIMAIPTIVDGGLALGYPRPAHGGLQHEAALIAQDNGAALTPGFF